MFEFLKPQWVVVRWNNQLGDYRFFCTFNRHFCIRAASTRFWFKFNAERELKKHLDFVRWVSYGDVDETVYEVLRLNEISDVSPRD